MSLKITTHKLGTDVHVTLYGFIDETCIMPVFNEEIYGRLILNLEYITLINSLGTRRWLSWIKTLKANGGIVLSKCSAPFVGQMNVLQNFVPEGVVVESFIVPYLCSKCTKEESVLFTVGVDSDASEIRACSACGGDMEMDVIKSKYFHFLKIKAA
ncbi:MAG: hypothetical protein ACXVA9_03790 [Bdellovibrionales bacterium]